MVEAPRRQRHQDRALRYDNQYCMVWRIENGKIKQIKEYCDSALVERVLGLFLEERKRTAGCICRHQRR